MMAQSGVRLRPPVGVGLSLSTPTHPRGRPYVGRRARESRFYFRLEGIAPAATPQCWYCLTAIATIVQRAPIWSSCAADVVPMHRMQRVGPSGASVVRPKRARVDASSGRSLLSRHERRRRAALARVPSLGQSRVGPGTRGSRRPPDRPCLHESRVSTFTASPRPADALRGTGLSRLRLSRSCVPGGGRRASRGT